MIRLDRSIQIMTDNRDFATPNAFNEKVEAWGEFKTVSAKFMPVSDGERLKNGQNLSDLTARFLIRWSPDLECVDPTYRVRYDGRDFDIQGVKEVAGNRRRQWLEITATARAEAS